MTLKYIKIAFRNGIEEYLAEASTGVRVKVKNFQKSMKNCCTHWVVTIIAKKVVRVGENHHFLSDSKKHEF